MHPSQAQELSEALCWDFSSAGGSAEQIAWMGNEHLASLTVPHPRDGNYLPARERGIRPTERWRWHCWFELLQSHQSGGQLGRAGWMQHPVRGAVGTDAVCWGQTLCHTAGCTQSIASSRANLVQGKQEEASISCGFLQSLGFSAESFCVLDSRCYQAAGLGRGCVPPPAPKWRVSEAFHVDGLCGFP